uniref:Transposable element P transposase-like GTP-binding insertion domain-containing protein n=1 Tax=Amphimedon queenslandica TaxID=400682 RepID=A0A1X7V0R5_AMPQE
MSPAGGGLFKVKLKYEHVHLNSYSKLRVDLASQVLSETVSCALKEDNHAKLAKFVEYFDHFFDCLNVTSISGGKHKLKKYSYPYRTANDDRLKWLAVDFMGYLDDWSKSVMERDGFSEEEKKKMSYSQQTIEGIQRTGQSLAESVDDHESQSTLVVDTATVDVQSIVAHSPSPYSSTSSTNTTTSILLPLQKSVLELDHPLLYYNNLRYQKIALKRVRKRGCGQNRSALRAQPISCATPMPD